MKHFGESEIKTPFQKKADDEQSTDFGEINIEHLGA